MEERDFEALVAKAKEDPRFFHDLVFDTDRAVEGIDFLTAGDKERILGTNPADVVKLILAGAKGKCGVTVQCTRTCGVTALKDLGVELLARAADCGVTVNCTSTCTHTVSRAAEEFGDQIGDAIRAQIG
jgi:hypothetical protein